MVINYEITTKNKHADFYVYETITDVVFFGDIRRDYDKELKPDEETTQQKRAQKAQEEGR